MAAQAMHFGAFTFASLKRFRPVTAERTELIYANLLVAI
jgi:hypothetical protein